MDRNGMLREAIYTALTSGEVWRLFLDGMLTVEGIADAIISHYPSPAPSEDALRKILSAGHNDDCLFCAMKDNIANSALRAHAGVDRNLPCATTDCEFYDATLELHCDGAIDNGPAQESSLPDTWKRRKES